MPLGLPPVNDAVTWAGSIAVGAISISLAVQKVLHIWSNGATSINASQGENQVVTLLREELDRMSTQNSKLDSRVMELITLVESLRKENYDLHTTMGGMSKQIATLVAQELIRNNREGGL